NVSTWLTPPDMKRKMQRRAAGAKWGGLGASGLAASSVFGALRASSASNDASARAPRPLNERHNTSRRETKARSIPANGRREPAGCVGELLRPGLLSMLNAPLACATLNDARSLPGGSRPPLAGSSANRTSIDIHELIEIEEHAAQSDQPVVGR